MKQKMPLGLLLGLIFILLLLHLAGTYFQFYWRIPGYDRVVHILGSFWITTIILLYILQIFKIRKTPLIVLGIIVAIVVGIGWEYFELKTGITNVHDRGYNYDTIADLVSDVVGGLLALPYVFFRINKISEPWQTEK